MMDLRWIARLAIGLFALSGPGLVFAGALTGDTQPRLAGTALARELQKGGYVIFFRHGSTVEFSEKDVTDANLDNCQIQRNLSEEGRAQTRQIGEAFRRLQIPMGDVYSSPYCRCLETARNIFGKAEKSKALHFAIQLRPADRAMVTAQLLNMLATPPRPGTNTGLVSHTANLQEAVGIWPKPEGVAHVFKPEANGQFSYVGVMMPEAWRSEAARVPGRGGALSTIKEWFGGSSDR